MLISGDSSPPAALWRKNSAKAHKMGKISQTLTGRFRKHRKFAQQLHQQAKQDAVQVPKDVRSVQQLVEHEGYDPLHAAYISAQNLASFFVESVSAFDEFNAYWDIVEPAQDE